MHTNPLGHPLGSVVLRQRSFKVAEDETALFKILKDCKDTEDYSEFLNQLEQRFPELIVLKGGCQVRQHVVRVSCFVFRVLCFVSRMDV
jgi:hypothetical protein